MADLITGIMRAIQKPKKKRSKRVEPAVPSLAQQVSAAAKAYRTRTGRKATVAQIGGFGVNGNKVAGYTIEDNRIAGLDVVGGPGEMFMLVGEYVNGHALEEAT